MRFEPQPYSGKTELRIFKVGIILGEDQTVVAEFSIYAEWDSEAIEMAAQRWKFEREKGDRRPYTLSCSCD
jgi:hypothetical protein